MFKLSEIKELIKLVDQSTLQELEIQNENARLLIRKPNQMENVLVSAAPQHVYVPQVAAPAPERAAAPASEPAADSAAAKTDDASLHKIVSPMVGTFYSAPSPGAEPYVSIGSQVSEKSVVCIVEAMKLMNPIEAEVRGEIVDILVENGQLVEYGQTLFLVKR